MYNELFIYYHIDITHLSIYKSHDSNSFVIRPNKDKRFIV